MFVWLSNAFDFLKFLYPKGKVSVEMRTPCGIRWPSPDGENRAREQCTRKRHKILANLENIFNDGIFAKPIKIYLVVFADNSWKKKNSMLQHAKFWKGLRVLFTSSDFHRVWGSPWYLKYSTGSLINFRGTSGRKQPSLQHKVGWREHAVLLNISPTKRRCKKSAKK